MFRTLVHTETVDVEGRSYVAHFFERKTARGTRRYCCEIMLPGERIILDDDSMTSLSTKVARLAPAMMYSRTLGSGPKAA
ncbi:MAG TPA: hypothetical protein VL484_08530 [Vicinamibacterales bacterium]|jgi:hypothetical protein|nr:hypothetical protein [Vicinamibacterales bacterium]